MDPLVALRDAIAQNSPLQLQNSGEDVAETEVASATDLKLAGPDDSVILALSTETRFESRDPETKKLDLRTVYNAWITRNLNVTDYITVSTERGIFNLKFLERTDLLTWLEGASDESEHIIAESGAPGAPAAAPSGGVPAIAPELELILKNEHDLVNHNTVLRGAKQVSFASVSAECRQKIIYPYKQAAKGRPVASAAATKPDDSKGRKKEPIVILSPSASALLNMANVKQFFEEGSFRYEPSASGAANIQYITRNSQKLGGSIRVVVVNSVERFKPEYWDRVVAVFVTGQPWQLKPYKWSDPNVLFQRVLGFSLNFKGDPLPPALTNWKVDVIPVDRNTRFRDREVVERIWDKIEYSLYKRGYRGHRR